MTPKQFRTALERLCWTQRGLASFLGISYNQVNRWAMGTANIPAPMATWLAGLAEHHRDNPPPPYQPESR